MKEQAERRRGGTRRHAGEEVVGLKRVKERGGGLEQGQGRKH